MTDTASSTVGERCGYYLKYGKLILDKKGEDENVSINALRFIKQMIPKLEQYKNRCFFSPSQKNWFDTIIQKSGILEYPLEEE